MYAMGDLKKYFMQQRLKRNYCGEKISLSKLQADDDECFTAIV